MVLASIERAPKPQELKGRDVLPGGPQLSKRTGMRRQMSNQQTRGYAASWNLKERGYAA